MASYFPLQHETGELNSMKQMVAGEGLACTTAFLVFAAIAAILRKRGAYVIATWCIKESHP